ncbi:unnamed protein product [Calicophoron daubneyi]|uniref:Serine/threonine-protein phosphatase PGAM5, mitochondrial n=1 Tax=Calicophoron daubneyi TaxID=300641 RepID=A0AAV2U034_CALDB
MTCHRAVKVLAGGFIAALATLESQVSFFSSRAPPDDKNPHNSLPWALFSKVFQKKQQQEFPSPTPFQAHIDSKPVSVKPWNWNWDGRHPSVNELDGGRGDSSHHPRCSRHLIFIRHGQYVYANADSDCHLTQLGHEQLNYTGMRLKQLNFPYSALHYSTMTRAVESTEEVIKHITTARIEPTDLLREGAPYSLEPPLPYYQPTEEELKEEGGRIESAFKSYVHRPDPMQKEDSYEIFICHANVIRYFVCRALQIPPEAWIRFSLDHGSITWLVVRSDGRVILRWLGNSGHMPPDKISVQ